MTDKLMKVKVCLIGDAQVGKTSLIHRFVMDVFDDRYVQTLGTKVSKKEMKIDVPRTEHRMNVHMTIWDIMGQKGFRELLKDAYFQGASGIVAVCDLTNRASLDDLDDWIESVKAIAGKIPAVFVANKVDLAQEKQFGEEEIANVAKAHGSSYYLTSAKTGVEVENAFQTLASIMVEAKMGNVQLERK